MNFQQPFAGGALVVLSTLSVTAWNVLVRALSVLLLTTTVCFAAVLTIDFDDQPHGIYPQNLITSGIRFSPNCHYDILPGGFQGSNWIGFDISGCGQPGHFNDNYLGRPGGPGNAWLYVDAFGAPFSLLSLYVVRGGWDLVSSRGGLFRAQFPDGELADISGTTVVFSGPEWRNVEWLHFETVSPGPEGFDNLRIVLVGRAPEPSTLALLLVPCALLLWRAGCPRRHRRCGV